MQSGFIKYRHLSLFGLLLFFIVLAGSCSVGDKRPESNKQMAATLAQYADRLNPQVNPFANTARISFFESHGEPHGEIERIIYRIQLNQERLYAGQTETAIRNLKETKCLMERSQTPVPVEINDYLINLLALSYLRLGEQVNCEMNHTSASCIIPISGEGIHQDTRGSEGAIHFFTKLLERNPEDYLSIWLLNVAYMTLDRYPDDVPEQWRIPEEAFVEPVEFPRFIDIAIDLGLDVIDLSGGSVADDFTGNGLIDILTSSWGLKDQMRFFANNGDGSFSDKTIESGLEGITGGLNMVQADYTNNGFPDVFVMRGAWMGRDGRHPNSLLRNNGDGTFTDVTDKAGLMQFYPTGTAAWSDFNGNGWVDLFVGNESTDQLNARSYLFKNNGDGTFTDVSEESGVKVNGFVKGAVWGDINNNGRPDLYLSRMNQPNQLFRNDGIDADGNYTFTEIGQAAGVTEPEQSFTTWFWDVNNNGYEDILVFGYYIEPGDIAREYLGQPTSGEYPRLYLNNGDETFTDVTTEAGLDKMIYTMGANFGDLNNDGFLDFYAGTGDPDMRSIMPNRMFRNKGNSTFEEVTVSGGFGNLQKGHGVSFADFNNNGQQDIYIDMGGALEGDTYQNLFFKNPGNKNNWIILTLIGVESNRAAIGARIRVTAVNDEGEESVFYRTVNSGGSFGASPFRQEIGLGNTTQVRNIQIQWPSGIVQQFEQPSARRLYEITEGSPDLVESEVGVFEYRLKSREHHH